MGAHSSENKPRPLQGVRVIELGSLIAGPFAGHLLADFGAEVIKIETPGKGDELRTWRYVPEETKTSLWWYLQARNKKCITLDLRLPEGQDLMRRLVGVSDALIENFRPGTLDRWGLSFDSVHALNPRIILVSVSGYGQTGPYRTKPGFASVAEGISGIRHLTGYPDRPPVRVGISLADHVAGMHALFGLLMALFYRDARGTGVGQQVDVALHEAMFTFMESMVPEFDVTGAVWERFGTTLPSTAPSNTYPTADGKHVVIGANNDNLFRRLMHAIGRDDLATDARFQNNVLRVHEREFLDGVIAGWTADHRLADIVRIVEECQVPVGPIYTPKEIVKDPQYIEREMLTKAAVPGLGEVMFPGIVPKMSETPGGVDWVGPALGQHNREVYMGILGLGEQEFDELTRKGVV